MFPVQLTDFYRPQRSCSKVMFYTCLSVCHSVHRGRGHAWYGRGHAWQGTCMAGEGMHAGGLVWQGTCMAGGMHSRGHVWWRHVWQGACVHHRLPPPEQIRSMSWRYASYWNAFLNWRPLFLTGAKVKSLLDIFVYDASVPIWLILSLLLLNPSWVGKSDLD